MMIGDLKEVFFVAYCPTCKYKEGGEEEFPCCDCLEIPGREDSHVPEFYKQKET